MKILVSLLKKMLRWDLRNHDTPRIAGKIKDELSMVKQSLSETFDMKKLGDANHIIGMCISHDRSKCCIYLYQSEYIYPNYLRRLFLKKVLSLFSVESEEHYV